MSKVITNLHTHTFRCGHAVGNEREYIERAIQNGIKVMGFSDHMPFVFPDGRQSGYRVKADMAEDYIKTLEKLKREYRDKIDIHIGFEMEYYPDHFKDMFGFALDLGAEYLILGEHFPSYEDGRFKYVGNQTTDENALYYYVKGCIDGMKTGVFTYLAHPDAQNFVGDNAVYEREMTKLCKAARMLDIPLEINFLGIRGARHYPRDFFWQIAGSCGCKAVYGFDAHDPDAAFDGGSVKIADEIVQKYGLTLVETPKIIDIQEIKL